MNTRRITRRSRRSGNSDSTRHRCARGSSRSPRTAFVLSGGGNQAVSRVGVLPRVARARHRRCGRRVLRERGTDPGGCGRSRKAVDRLAEMWVQLSTTSSSRRAAVAWNLLTRDDHLFSDERACAPSPRSVERRPVRGYRHPAAGGRRRPRHGRGGVFACGRLRPALSWPQRCPGLFPPRAVRRTAARRRRRGRHGVPLSHLRPGPGIGVYVLNVSRVGSLTSHPPVAARRAREGVARSVASNASAWRLRSVPGERRGRRAPAPVDDRDIPTSPIRAATSTRRTAPSRSARSMPPRSPPTAQLAATLVVAPHRRLTLAVRSAVPLAGAIRSASSGTRRTGTARPRPTPAARRTARSSCSGRTASAHRPSTRRPSRPPAALGAVDVVEAALALVEDDLALPQSSEFHHSGVVEPDRIGRRRRADRASGPGQSPKPSAAGAWRRRTQRRTEHPCWKFLT